MINDRTFYPCLKFEYNYEYKIFYYELQLKTTKKIIIIKLKNTFYKFYLLTCISIVSKFFISFFKS